VDYINILENINKQLSIIAESVSAKDYSGYIIPWGLGAISSFVGAIIMFIITSILDKIKFKRDSQIEDLKRILVDQIHKTDELILGCKINEPNYFNKIQENQEIERQKTA
jgi:hypothetical protein